MHKDWFVLADAVKASQGQCIFFPKQTTSNFTAEDCWRGEGPLRIWLALTATDFLQYSPFSTSLTVKSVKSSYVLLAPARVTCPGIKTYKNNSQRPSVSTTAKSQSGLSSFDHPSLARNADRLECLSFDWNIQFHAFCAFEYNHRTFQYHSFVWVGQSTAAFVLNKNVVSEIF